MTINQVEEHNTENTVKQKYAFLGGGLEEDPNVEDMLEDSRVTNMMLDRIVLIDKALIAFALMSITLSMIEVSNVVSF
jgi:hypothetical protein